MKSREERLNDLKGKVVVYIQNPTTRKKRYLQDPTFTYNPNYHWTNFKANARAFDSQQEAYRTGRQYSHSCYVEVVS